jgi:hypothetical protein
MFSRTCFVVSCVLNLRQLTYKSSSKLPSAVFFNAGYRLRPFCESPLRLILLFLKLGLNEERLLLLCVPASL